MFKKLKYFHTKQTIKAQVSNSLNDDIKETKIRFGLSEDVIDEKLLKEDIEVIKLYYDKYSKWIDLHNASVLGFLALTFGFWGGNWMTNTFLLICLISSFIGAYQLNRNFNISFNTLLKKTKEQSKK